ncbi:MAG: glycosyltransferase family 2 protein [Acidobacteriota bacterium]|nr:glycosyltransferase family 2 protein [Acidobacteriota bacterium]
MIERLGTAAENIGPAEPPSVCVIIPAYNAAQYIGETLESVFAQTYKDFEAVVVNDGSPDTPELERALAPYMDRIRYIKQENRGPSGARNLAILQSRAPFVAFLDSDDLWLPSYLSEQMKVFSGDPQLDLVYCDALLFGDSPLAGRTFMQQNPSAGEASFENLLKEQCTIITSCAVARREALIAAGLFDENFYHSEDFDLWLRLAFRGGRIGYQKQVLAKHRIHGASLGADVRRLMEGELRVHKKLMSSLPLSSAQLGMVERQVKLRQAELDLENGKQQFAAREYAEARESLGRANEFYKSGKLRLALFILRIAPGALRYMYGIWQWILMRRLKGSSRPRRRSNEREVSGKRPCVELQDS